MAIKFWDHLTLKNRDIVKFVPPEPDGSRLGGVTQEQKQSIASISAKIDKSALFDAGIKSMSWNQLLPETQITTVEDPYKSQRPSGTNMRYWTQTAMTGARILHSQTFKVVFDGVQYNNLCVQYSCINESGTSNMTVHSTIGNKYLYDSRYYDDGLPFCIIYIYHGTDIVATTSPYYYSSTIGNIVIFFRSASTHKIKLMRATMTIDSLPKALSQNYGFADELYSKIQGSSYIRYSLGHGNISGRNSFSIGTNNISTSYNSVAIGQCCISTNTGLAQGKHTQSHGAASHSQGKDTMALAIATHAQGSNTIAFSQQSHAQGDSTRTFDAASHAQGWDSVAAGMMSHAQSSSCAYGIASHSQGMVTIAAKKGQHAAGRYNIIDNNNVGSSSVCCQYAVANGTTSAYSIDQSIASVDSMLTASVYINGKSDNTYTYTISGHTYTFDVIPPKNSVIVLRYRGFGGTQFGKYVNIIGNGLSDTNRSNAHTLDWDGNAWYSGDVYVGSTSGTNRDDGSVKLAKITDIPQTATVDQTKSYLGIGGD